MYTVGDARGRFRDFFETVAFEFRSTKLQTFEIPFKNKKTYQTSLSRKSDRSLILRLPQTRRSFKITKLLYSCINEIARRS